MYTAYWQGGEKKERQIPLIVRLQDPDSAMVSRLQKDNAWHAACNLQINLLGLTVAGRKRCSARPGLDVECDLKRRDSFVVATGATCSTPALLRVTGVQRKSFNDLCRSDLIDEGLPGGEVGRAMLRRILCLFYFEKSWNGWKSGWIGDTTVIPVLYWDIV